MKTAELKLRASVLECAAPAALSIATKRHKNTQNLSAGNSLPLIRLVRNASFSFFVLFCAFLWQSLFAAEHHTTLTIKPDGSSVLKTDKTEPRPIVEQQVRIWERFESQRDNTDEDVKPSKPAEVKPFTDDELAKKIRHTSEVQADQAGEDSSQKIE